MTSWRFHNPVDVESGAGVRLGLLQPLAELRCLIVCSARGRHWLAEDRLLGAAARRPNHVWVDEVTANPTLQWLESKRDALQGERLDAVIGLGGGSSLDSAKVLAVSLPEALSQVPIIELITHPERLAASSGVPLTAVPTTAGTGSEVTPFATAWDHRAQRKRSLAAPQLYPQRALVDPELCASMPASVTRATGLDAINQALESIWNRRATPVSEALATRALVVGLEALPRVWQQPTASTRAAMAECSVLAGLAISQTRTALCHAMSYPLTLHYGVPHGLACAFTMPAVLRRNIGVDDGRMRRLARQLFGDSADTSDLIERLDTLHEQLDVRAAVKAGLPSREQLLSLAPEMPRADRSANNLAEADETEIRALLVEAWGDY